MRHLHTGRKLGVAPHHRKALLRNLTLALIEKETIRTTPARAKEIRWFAERIVTLAKKGDVAGRRRIVRILGSTETYQQGENRIRNAVDRVYSQLAPRFKDRNGGFTQILRLTLRRPGDNAEMCVMRYLPVEDEKGSKKGDSKKKLAKAEGSAKKQKSEKKAEVQAASGDKPHAEDMKPSDKPGKKKEHA